MAKTETTVKGYAYTVTSPNGGTVTDAEGKLSKPVAAGDQVTVTAPSDSLTCDDDDAVICKANFKSPLLALRLLGQGENALPAGYTRLEFLESTGTQYINTGIRLDEGFVLRCEFVPTQILSYGCVFGARLSTKIVHFMRSNTAASYSLVIIRNGSLGYISFPVNLNESYSLELNDIDKKIVLNGEETSGLDFYSMPELDFYIFCENFPQGGNLVNGARAVWFDAIRLMSFEISNAGRHYNFVPALDTTGTPCMYDRVSGKPVYNDGTGQFIAGFALSQAAQLGRKLPSTGGKLTVSLPEGYDMDERVVNSLAEAESKGWVLTIQTYAAQTAAATFALRRVWVRRVQDENGSYVSADCSRWQVEWCVDVIGADPESLGYERFRSVDAATEYWGLVPYVDPDAMDDAMGDNRTLMQGGTLNTSPETNS